MKNTTFGFYNENSAKNAPYLKINGVSFYFSYSTLVGIAFDEGNDIGFYVLQNPSGNTTGKHLNWLDNKDHENRLDRSAFLSKVKLAMKQAKIKELPTINI